MLHADVLFQALQTSVPSAKRAATSNGWSGGCFSSAGHAQKSWQLNPLCRDTALSTLRPALSSGVEQRSCLGPTRTLISSDWQETNEAACCGESRLDRLEQELAPLPALINQALLASWTVLSLLLHQLRRVGNAPWIFYPQLMSVNICNCSSKNPEVIFYLFPLTHQSCCRYSQNVFST